MHVIVEQLMILYIGYIKQQLYALKFKCCARVNKENGQENTIKLDRRINEQFCFRL